MKIKIIETKDSAGLECELNDFNSTHNVSYTQTHVTFLGEGNSILYTAILFYNDKVVTK